MAYVLSSVSGNLISAASAGFAPTNSADVSAIASAYQVVSATATQLYAGTAFVTEINGSPVSASRAGNAANASMANSAYYDGTGRLISALPDSATVSAIASSYAESAASSKQDTLTFGYDTADKISSINGSSLAGEGGGLVTALGTGTDHWYQNSVSSINNMNLSAKWADSASNAATAGAAMSATFAQTADYAKTVAPSAVSAYISAVESRSGTIIVTNRTGIDATDSAVVGEYVPGYSGISTYANTLVPFNGARSAVFTGIPDSLPVTLSLAMYYGSPDTITFSGSNGTTASASYAGSPTALTADLGKVSSVYIYTQNQYIEQNGLTYTADAVDNASIVALAHASALPTYQYDAEDKISSINGSALAGGMDSATCSAIASAYAESAASSKLDTTAFNSGDFYTTANESGFVDSAYVDSAISGKADASALSSYYTTANESGFITGVDLTDYATTAYVDSAVSSKADSSALSSYVPYSSLEYNTASAISGINGSALAAGSTYSAGEGIDITDDVISVETPVDIVAGPGIVIDNPDGNTLRVSLSNSIETVLWDGPSVWVSASPTIELSESISSFERIGIYAGGYANTNQQDFKMLRLSAEDTANGAPLNIQGVAGNGTFVRFNVGLVYPSANGSALSFQNFNQFNLGATVNTAISPSKIQRIVGINRTASAQ